jgi:hypothetical protein
LLLDELHRSVESSGRNALLAIVHQAIDELGDKQAVKASVMLQLLATSRKLLNHRNKLSITQLQKAPTNHTTTQSNREA